MKRHHPYRTMLASLSGSAALFLALLTLIATAGQTATTMAIDDINGSGASAAKPKADAPAVVSTIGAETAADKGEKTPLGSVGTGACCPDAGEPCTGDINGDSSVNGLDLLIMLSAWGPCADPNDCPADLNGDTNVDGLDLLIMLSAWGECPDGNACEQTSLEACEDLEGYFLGEGTICEDCPQPVACPGGAIIENEPCGEAINDGCNLDPPAYGEMLTCGDAVCGTLWAQGDDRDQDWHRITITQDTSVSWSVEAAYPVEARILTHGCPAIVVAAAAGENPTVQACLPPGEYVLVVRPNFHAGLPCGSELTSYVATVDCELCTVPTGACCTPDNKCSEMPALTCFQLDEDAQYMGNGTTCGQVECPFGPPLGLCEDNCGEIFVDDTIGGFCHCDDDFCALDPQSCCPGVCDDCPDLPQCDPTFICDTATGDCCTQNPTPGCEEPGCCEAVCSCDPFCCEDQWDPFCAMIGPCSAASLCPQCGGGGCPVVTCTNNEGEPCGAAINDGCAVDESNPPFGTIECGQTVCGNLWAATSPKFPSGARDSDWFLLDLSDADGPVEVTWSVEATHPVLLFVLTPECPGEIIEGPIQGCSGSITLCLDPGEYVLYVSPTVFDGLPCPGYTYQATLTCDSEACYSGQCKGNCGGGFGPPGCYDTMTCECYCDDNCAAFGDCCPGICIDCPSCFGCPGGQGCN